MIIGINSLGGFDLILHARPQPIAYFGPFSRTSSVAVKSAIRDEHVRGFYNGIALRYPAEADDVGARLPGREIGDTISHHR